MLNIVYVSVGGDKFPIILNETGTQYSGVNILYKPGVYEELQKMGVSSFLYELEGTIGNYATKMIGLVPVLEADTKVQMIDYTNHLTTLLSMPETAANALIERQSEDVQRIYLDGIETIRAYEALNYSNKVYLPESAFEYMGEGIAAKMRPSSTIVPLKDVDNQVIFQKAYDAEYGFSLPDLSQLHSSYVPTADTLEFMRILAPYRGASEDKSSYNSIYHTPHYRVHPRLRGTILSHLSWLNGKAKNDTLPIQPYERHMFDNIVTFFKSDTMWRTPNIVNGLFENTRIGRTLQLIVNYHDADSLSEFVSQIKAECGDGSKISFDLTPNDEVELLKLFNDNFSKNDIIAVLRRALKVSDDYILDMLNALKPAQIVNSNGIYGFFDVSDNVRNEAEKIFIEKAVITDEAFSYICSMCICAYQVNWGHTGATHSVPGLEFMTGCDNIDKAMSAYLNGIKTGKQEAGNVLAPIYSKDYDIDNSDSDDDSGDDFGIQVHYYCTDATRVLLQDGKLNSEFFERTLPISSMQAASEADRIVQYWKWVRGDSNLRNFINQVFVLTADIKVLAEIFVKLCRWGDNKPMLLVIADHPEVRTVFDFAVAKEIANTAIVDENDLVYVNGCSYSLERFIVGKDIVGGKNTIFGALLSRNYGIKKFYVASLTDIGEMIVNNKVDIADLKTIQSYDVSLGSKYVIDTNELESISHTMFISDKARVEGLEKQIAPVDLNDAALLCTPMILRSSAYLRSKNNKEVITLKDRQYKILEGYVRVLNKISQSMPLVIDDNPVIDTTKFISCCRAVYQAMEGQNAVQSANEVRANANAAQLKFGDEEQTIKFDTTPLEGQFTLVSDVEMQAAMENITFSNESMVRLSQRMHNRVVMLILITDDKMIFCRKDIRPNEVRIYNNTVDVKKYSKFAPHIEALRSGKNPVANFANGTKKTLYLHESMKDFV